MGEGGSIVKMLVERANLSIYVDGMGPILKKAVWGLWDFFHANRLGVCLASNIHITYTLGVFDYDLTWLANLL
jgi:hypothetical protein